MGINSSKENGEGNEPVSAIPNRANRYQNKNRGQLTDDPRNTSHGSNSSLRQSELEDSSEDNVPTVFRWEHGGRNVFLTGTFNNWERQIPMHKSGNDFTYVHNLKRGKHAFKFIVDDEWRFAPDQPTIADVEGHINNFIDVSEFVPYVGDDKFFAKSKGSLLHVNVNWVSLLLFYILEQKIPEEEYKKVIPDLEEYTKEPPSLPPHLRHIILNKVHKIYPIN